MHFYSIKKIRELCRSDVVRNSFWGLAANASQSLLVSLLYVILARKYSTSDFSYFLIANAVYQFLAAISNLGLGQWFMREMTGAQKGESIINKFLKLQLYSGLGFYLINCLLAFALYDNQEVRLLTMMLGLNIVFDNLIYVIKSLNILRSAQNLTFKIIVADALLKFLAVLAVLVWPLSIISLTAILICIRFLTLNLFLKYGSKEALNLKLLIGCRMSLSEVKKIILANWPFLVIGSVSVVYWRVGSIIISKMLSLYDIAVYEISCRIFSAFALLPLVVSGSLFPHLVALHRAGDKAQFIARYRKYFKFFLVYGLFAYTAMYSFSGYLIPFVFGPKYAAAPEYTVQMLLTLLLFPTAILQATVLVAMGLERKDMVINIISVMVVVALILGGLFLVRSLTVVNISIFISFLVFHICQDYFLFKREILSRREMIHFYGFSAAFVLAYVFLETRFPAIAFFTLFWALSAAVFAVSGRLKIGRSGSAIANTDTI